MSGTLSAAGWSDRGSRRIFRDAHHGGGQGDEPHPFGIDRDERYDAVEVAGRGGMGEVMVAHDRRLGRDVALKRIALDRDDAVLSRRLAREAWITARLEHPSIVPLYDAGIGDDGRLYYTMRLIHGRSLADALDQAARLADRMALLRHFLAVCEAVAYAHDHGIVHRDLKPANIMVGAFGETQLVDWGLAGFVDENTATAFIADSAIPAAALTNPGVLGTPAYMSPEQARGQLADRRGDVWALGAILHELVSGERLLAMRSAEQALDMLRHGAVAIDRTPLRATGAPGELCDIVEKATAIEPAARYADAAEMAADLTRYLDGAPVHAHVYTTLELAARLVRRLRVPLFVLGGALLAASVALTLTFRRINAERERAQTAERGAHVAADESRRTSSWALARQSVTELSQGAIPEADVLASHALLRGESPDARGVVAATWASPRIRSPRAFELPGCERVVPGTWDLALCQSSGAVELWELEPLRMRWRRELPIYRSYVSVADDGRPRVFVISGADDVVILDGNSGAVLHRHTVRLTTGMLDAIVDSTDGRYLAVTEGRTLSVIGVEDDAPRVLGHICDPSSIVAIAGGAGSFVVACEAGDLLRLDAATGAFTRVATIDGLGPISPICAALSHDGSTLAVGGVRGDLLAIDLARGQVTARLRASDVLLSRVGFVGASRSLLVVAPAHRGIGLWNLQAGLELLRLPAAAGYQFAMDPRGLITGGRRAGRWLIPETSAPRAMVVPAGLAAIAASSDGALLAAARGDGRVTIWERATGRVAAELLLGTSVVKSIDFSPDSRRLAVSVSRSRHATLVLEVGVWNPMPFGNDDRGARRFAFNSDGELVGAHYAPPLSITAPDGATTRLPAPEMIDLSTSVDRRRLLLLSREGAVWRLVGHDIQEITALPGALAVAAWARGTRVAIATDGGVAIRDEHEPAAARDPSRPGTGRWIPDPTSRLSDIAISPDDRYLVGAHTDGTIAVWSLAGDRLVATLRGHRDRVAQVAFLPSGLLVSGGWDGRVLTWDLSVLEVPAAELVARAEAAWPGGLSLAVDSHVP